MKTFIALSLSLFGLSALAAELRDPMRPPTVSSKTAVRGPEAITTKVTALFISGSRRAALVDGQLVHAGDRAGACLVEAVLDDGVRCRYPKEVRVVLLPRTEQQIKKPTAAAVAANGAP